MLLSYLQTIKYKGQALSLIFLHSRTQLSKLRAFSIWYNISQQYNNFKSNSEINKLKQLNLHNEIQQSTVQQRVIKLEQENSELRQASLDGL